MDPARDDVSVRGEAIRVRGLVQGVGFRPTVWRLATRHRLSGWVANDGEGVRIVARGRGAELDAFAAALLREAPVLARIDAIDREPTREAVEGDAFRIVDSQAGAVRTHVVADAAPCAACLAEIRDRSSRRYRYPFTNCTHCGPRLSIVQAIPYDRATTTMRAFSMCPDCAAEYADPADRRFHAQPIACPRCGPTAWVEGRARDRVQGVDPVDVAARLVGQGCIVAVKGVGGFQLACDAGDEVVVARLRRSKRRARKPFALLARDLPMVRRFACLDSDEALLLGSAAAPIVLLEAAGELLAPSVAPGLQTLGFMLPASPLHHLLMQDMQRPIVLTSGNLSDEPQCIDNDEARARLGGLADAFLMHDRPIARRVDDSVARVGAGRPQLLRRARGYAPAPIRLHEAFRDAPPVLALGGELKNTICLLRDGGAVLSHHIGDLEEALTHADWRRAIDDYIALFGHSPRRIAVDLHPGYLSRARGIELAAALGVALDGVQHHHAHVAASLAENGMAPQAPPVLGIVLDGLGWGEDGTWWGGEFLLADFRRASRLGRLAPVAMPGGSQAVLEPWRNTYAHLVRAFGPRLAGEHGGPELQAFLAEKPRGTLDAMLARGVNSPLASSCGRLFDAVAAAAGVCRDRALYEGQAAIEFEALADPALADEEAQAYPFALSRDGEGGLMQLEPAPMWQALLGDLEAQVPVSVVSTRFHLGLADAIAEMTEVLGRDADVDPRVAVLSGGVFHNRTLLQLVQQRLAWRGWRVLTQAQVPAGDGGLSLGQAAIAGARALPA